MGTSFKDYLGNKDVKYWDGVTRTFTRRISTGALITLNKIGHVVDVLEAYGSGTTYTSTAINAALSGVASNKVGLLLQPGAWTISAAVTIPANCTLIVPHGAEITINTGVTLTVNGPIVAGAYEIFKGTGTLAGTPLLQYWDATWINGTVTDSTTKSYKALTFGALTFTSVTAATITATTAVVTDTVSERTSAAGVTVDGMQIKDSAPYCDTINEKTSAAGVTVDGVQLKDSQVYTDTINEKTAAAGVTIDGVVLKDSGVTATSCSLLPAGTMLMYGAAAAPTGYLLCDGSAVSRTTYAGLFTAIGITWGSGDGATTFNVPNMKGRSPVGVGQGNTAEGGGAGTNRVLAATAGAETHTMIEAEMPAHTHGLNAYVALGAGAVSAISSGGSGNVTGSTGGDGAHNNMGPVIAVNFIIKT